MRLGYTRSGRLARVEHRREADRLEAGRVVVPVPMEGELQFRADDLPHVQVLLQDAPGQLTDSQHGERLGQLRGKHIRQRLWVPKTGATWADALQSAVPCPVPGEPVSGPPGVR